MEIACPRCDESYRLDVTRMPGARVRTACLACGEPLFLRVTRDGRRVDADAGPVWGGAATTAVEDVPLWNEPGPPDLAERLGIAAMPEVPEREDAGPASPDLTEAAVIAELAAEESPPEAPAAEEALVPHPESLPDERPPAPHVAPDSPPGPPGFTFARVGDVSGRAQRLARALVSDILVYHPKKVEQGLREGSLKEVMREEVEKSWDEYCERLGADVARANRSHFVAALNQVLARGNPVF